MNVTARRVASAFALLAVGILALAGCAPSHMAGPSPHGTHSAVSTASPAPTAAARPAISDLVISTTGLGSLHVGSPVPAEAASTALVSWSATACVSAETGIAAGSPRAGAWKANYDEISGPAGLRDPFIVTTADGAQGSNLSLVWAWGGGIHTAKGIQVGSTKAALTAAYRTFSSTVSGVVSDVYVINGPTGSLSFEVSKQNSDDGSNYWPDDEVDKVLWMGVTLPGASLGPIAASDGGPSTCPQND